MSTLRTDDPRHGSVAGHVAGCRQDCCNTAKCRYNKVRLWEKHTTGRVRTIDATGFRRRVRALQAIGWSLNEIADELGISWMNLRDKLRKHGRVRLATHQNMTAVYDRLSTRPAQSGCAAYVRENARRNGYVPPILWDDIDDPNAQPANPGRDKDLVDEVLVQRALSGQKVQASKAEKEEITRRWCQATGRSYADLERLTGWRVDRYKEAS